MWWEAFFTIKQVLKLFASIGAALGIGFLGAVPTISAIPTWYADLKKPFFAPPNWIFSPVWTVLYILMGISFWIYSRANVLKQKKRWSYALYVTQLILNLLWSYLFFGMKSPGLAFIEITVLWAFIFLTRKMFSEDSKWAGRLLTPYLAWVSFAAILNFEFFRLNF